jgi:hypothetical protein
VGHTNPPPQKNFLEFPVTRAKFLATWQGRSAMSVEGKKGSLVRLIERELVTILNSSETKPAEVLKGIEIGLKLLTFQDRLAKAADDDDFFAQAR